jgi:hypothetical protein
VSPQAHFRSFDFGINFDFRINLTSESTFPVALRRDFRRTGNWHLSHRTWRQKLEPEDVFRETNELIAEKAREFGFQLPVPFICECSDQRCHGYIKVTLEEYEEARTDPHRYLTIAGHEVIGARVIAREEHFALAEKL